MKKTVLLVLLLIGGLTTSRAQNRVEADLSMDLVSSYVWRGMRMGGAALQPELSLGWKGVSISAWGSTGFADNMREIDLTLSYSIGGLTLSVVDYWDNSGETLYFNYKPKETGHCFEGAVEYDFGPVKASWQTIFAGNDYRESDGKRGFSSYLEISAPFRLGSLDWEAALGMVPWASDYYGTKSFNVTCVSLKAQKDIHITDKFDLPLYASLIANPSTGRLFFVAGLTVKLF